MESAPQTLSPEILLTHAEFIRGLARRLIRDEQKAEDVTQDVWVAALEKPAADVASVRAWLAGTARNLVRRTVRTEGRAQNRERAVAQSEAVRSTDELVEAEDARRRVVEALLTLKEPYRSAILYRFYDDLPPRKIARRLGVPVETVKTRIQRGLDQLRRRLDSEYGAQAAWCLPLATAAGLKLTGTSSAVLTGVLAMSLKLKIGIAAALTAVLVGSLIYFWQPESHNAQVGPNDAALVAGHNAEARPDGGADPDAFGRAAREPIAPGSDAGRMPASYRKALGGFRGRVIDEGGAPVADRTVRLTGVRMADILQGRSAAGSDSNAPPKVDLKTDQTFTDKEGVFFFGDVHPRAYHLLRVDRTRQGFVTRVVDAQPSPGEVVDLGDIVLGPCATLTGKVVDGAGTPLANVRVRAADLPAEIFRKGLHTFREGCLILFEWRLFTMVRYVIDPPPAVLQLLRMLPIGEARTGPDGTFRLDEVPFGKVHLIADKKGFVTCAASPINLSDKGAHDAGTIALDAGVVIRGQVKGHDGKPVPGAEIFAGAILGTGALQVLHPAVRTDSDGFFTFEGAVALPTLFVLRAHRHDAWTFVGPLDPGSDALVVPLGAAHDLRLEIIDADRAPVSGASVRLREKSFQNIFPSDAPVAIDEQIERAGPGELIVKHLAPGEYNLVITAPGFGTAVEKIEIRGEPLEKTIVLKPAAMAGVRVVAAKTGAPIEWAEIIVGAGISDWIEQSLQIVRAKTDSDGRAAFELPSPGKYTVVVTHPGYAGGLAELEIPSDKETVIALKPGGAIDGIVHLPEGIDPLRHSIALDYRSGEDIPDVATPYLAVLNGEGRFRIRNLNPGSYDVYLIQRLFHKAPLTLFDTFQQEPIELGSVDVVSAETVEAEFYLPLPAEQVPCGRVTGRVLVDGQPAQGAIVGVRFTSARVRVNDEGFFDLGPVEAGKRFLIVTLPPLPDGSPEISLEREIDVAADLPHFAEVAIATGSIFGKATLYPGKEPVRGVRVKAWIPSRGLELGEDFEDAIRRGEAIGDTVTQAMSRSPGPYLVSMETMTGVDGSFSIARVPVGDYQVRVETKTYGSRAAKGVEVTPRNAAGPVELMLYAPVAIKGWVRLPDSVQGADEIGLILYTEGAEPRNLLDALRALIVPALSGEVAGTRYAAVDRATGAFEFERMMPGAYRASLFVVFEDRPRGIPRSLFEPMEFDVPPEGVSDLVLYPVPRADSGGRTPAEEKGR